LASLIKNNPDTIILFTSRSGVKFTNVEDRLIGRLRFAQNLLVVFGAPRRGLPEILKTENHDIRSVEFVVNCFPLQGTKTVRLEEAILGTLAILNYLFSRP
jgi:predicted SPOUT superfamily RNA methylase MTH1